jgi:lipopolysaccharide/colanic/teichoic acid biosynthesis glycosyltransferase
MASDASTQLDATVRHARFPLTAPAAARATARPLTSPLADAAEQLVRVPSAAEQLVRITEAAEQHIRLADMPEQRTREEEMPAVMEASRSEMLNRVTNVAMASIALILLMPLFLIVAVAIRATSKGPIIYRQIRVGQDRRRQRVQSVRDRRRVDLGGRPFMIYKFRSMTVDAEKNGIVWAQKADSRVTPVGRILRLTRVDELPQLINVLLGDMNIVGPRPERPGIFLKLREHIPEYPLRQRAKPGITGLAQIEQDYDNSIADVRRKVQYDLTYIRQQSLAQDLRIMLNTLPVMLTRRGAR